MKIRTYVFHTSLATLLLLTAGCANKEAVQAAKPAAAAPVRIATVASRTMPVELQAIGNVEAISTVTIKAQISGQLDARALQGRRLRKKRAAAFYH